MHKIDLLTHQFMNVFLMVIVTILLSTHNIYFWLRNKKNNFQLSALILSVGLKQLP